MTQDELILAEPKFKAAEERWKETVATLIEKWRLDNGFATKTDLANRLKIGEKIYTTISRGTSVSSQEVYARMFLLTKIQALHPMNIPTCVKTTPRGKGLYVRKMTQEEWDTWLAANGEMFNDRPMQTPVSAIINRDDAHPSVALPIRQHPATLPSPATQPPTAITNMAQQIEQLMQSFSVQVAERVVRVLKAQGHPALVQTSDSEISQLIAQFDGFLRTYLSGTPEQRDWLFKTYGGELAAMQPLLDILTTGDEESRIKKTQMQSIFGTQEV